MPLLLLNSETQILNRDLKKYIYQKKPFGIEIVFTTENIESDFQKAIDAGAKEFEPLIEKPWGQKVGYVIDNNGFLIEICTPIKN